MDQSVVTMDYFNISKSMSQPVLNVWKLTLLKGMVKIRGEYNRIEKELGDLGEEDDGDGDGDGDVKEARTQFIKKVEPFLLRGETKVEEFKDTLNSAKDLIKTNVEMFGDDMKNWNSERAAAFFPTLLRLGLLDCTPVPPSPPPSSLPLCLPPPLCTK